MAEITLTKANFETEVLKSDKPVIVDFWASWCGPCKMLAPELEAAAKELGDAYKVGKLNVDDEMEIARTYGIVSIPTLIMFENGEAVRQTMGYQKREQLLAWVRG